MVRLPFEILVDIFSRGLGAEDKVQCALTCRNWYTKISGTVLYSQIRSKNPQCHVQTQDFIKYIHDMGVGRQILELEVEDISDPLAVSKLCPNLKSLKMSCWISDDWNDKDTETLARNWNKLKVIHEVIYNCRIPYLTMQLLEAPLCMTSLTSITICFSTRPVNVFLKFIRQLKHAPALQHLALVEVYNLDYKKLDMLHKNTSELKHLDVIGAKYTDEDRGLKADQPLPMNPSVASNLRSFGVEPSKKTYRRWRWGNRKRMLD